MKKIEAVIRPFKLDDVKAALLAAGVRGLTITEVRTSGRQPEHMESYRGTRYVVDLASEMKVELVVPDEAADRVVDAILLASRGGGGDETVFVYPVGEAVRIRTGERGNEAVTTESLQRPRPLRAHG